MSKKSLIMLVVIIVLLSTVYFYRQHQPVVKNISVFEIDSLLIKHIEISSVKDTVRIENDNGKWILGRTKAFPADKKKVSDLFKNVLNVKRSKKLISNDFKKQSEYQVSPDTGIRIRFFDQNKQVMSDFYLGLSSFYTYSSLRFSDSDEIYELDQNLSEYIFPNLQLWQDPVILPLKSEDIKRLNIHADNHIYSLENRGKTWFYKTLADSFEVATTNRSLFKILNILQNLQSVTTIENNEESRKNYAKNKIIELEILLKSGQQHRIRTWVHNEESCLLECSKNPSYFYIMHIDFVNRFIKTKEHFLDKSEQTY